MRFFFLFFFFFFLNFVRSSSKPQTIEIKFLRNVVELQTQFGLPKFFGATPWKPPKMEPQKINYFNGSS